MICLCLTGERLAENEDILRRYRSAVDLVELRVDLLSPDECAGLVGDPGLVRHSFPNVSRLLTCRRKSDGGDWNGSEEERLELLNTLSGRGFSYVDVEEDVPDKVVREIGNHGATIVRSLHSFEGVPENPVEVLDRLSRGGAIAKLACSVGDTNAVASLVDAAFSRPPGNHIVLGMGKYGLVTRLLAPRLGSAWTYCSPGDARQAAPGQVDPRELVERFGYRRIHPETSLFAIVGDPVGHSKSPEYHNARFIRDNLNAVYTAFPASDFEAFLRVARRIGLTGASVTVPHKASAARLADETDDSVRETGACNTLIREYDTYLGTNTDIPGFLDPLRPLFDRIRSATIIGAGGAARACAFALLSRGTDVCIANRTESKAHELAGELNAAMARMSRRDPGFRPGAAVPARLPRRREDIAEYRSLIVQTTSCGMTPEDDGDPIPDYSFDGSEIVYDIVYSPPVTRLLQRAERAGCATVPGGRMFEAQAAVQYELFRRAYWAETRRHGSGTPQYNGHDRGAESLPWLRR